MLSSLEMEEPAIEKLVSYLGNIKKQFILATPLDLSDQPHDGRFSNNLLSQVIRFSNKAKSFANMSKGITTNSSLKEVESFFDVRDPPNIRIFKRHYPPSRLSR